MKIAQINLPIRDNDGNSLSEVHQKLQDALMSAFGGFTAYVGVGAWRDNNGRDYVEHVNVYQIAVGDDPFQLEQVREIAIHFGEKANQDAVFIILDGKASIINLIDDTPTEGIHP